MVAARDTGDSSTATSADNSIYARRGDPVKIF